MWPEMRQMAESLARLDLTSLAIIEASCVLPGILLGLVGY